MRIPILFHTFFLEKFSSRFKITLFLFMHSKFYLLLAILVDIDY